jgi:hypothetical protein
MKSTLTAFLFSLVLTTGCSMTHSDPKNPKKNPHPMKRYEVTATADAPGPWDSVKGVAYFDVINISCVPQDSFTGARDVPSNGYDFELTRIDNKTWKGYFYQDFFVDEDYFGQGVCHWDTTGVGTVFAVRGEKFSSSFLLKDFLDRNPQVSYFKKSAYGDQTLVRYGAQAYFPLDPNVIEHLDAYFRITIAVKEVTP